MKNKETVGIVTITKEKFNKLSKEDKRIRIIKDVLERLSLKQFKAQYARFVCNITKPAELESERQLSTILKSPETTCEVCAKGGLFMAYVGIVNSYELGTTGYSGTSNIYRGEEMNSTEMQMLSKIFTKKQLALIETTFERRDFDWNARLTEAEIDKCKAFGSKYSHNPDELLTAICKNMLKNKGIFVL